MEKKEVEDTRGRRGETESLKRRGKRWIKRGGGTGVRRGDTGEA